MEIITHQQPEDAHEISDELRDFLGQQMREQMAAGIYDAYLESMLHRKAEAIDILFNLRNDGYDEWCEGIERVISSCEELGSSGNEHPLLPLSQAVLRKPAVLWVGRVDSDTLLAPRPHVGNPFVSVAVITPMGEVSPIYGSAWGGEHFNEAQAKLLANHAFAAYSHPAFPTNIVTSNLGQPRG